MNIDFNKLTIKNSVIFAIVMRRPRLKISDPWAVRLHIEE